MTNAEFKAKEVAKYQLRKSDALARKQGLIDLIPHTQNWRNTVTGDEPLKLVDAFIAKMQAELSGIPDKVANINDMIADIND